MNGDGILNREVASDITLLEKAEPLKSCVLGAIIRPATIRALRLGEYACMRVRRIENLLYVVLFVMLAKPANVTIWDLVLWVVGK